MTKKILWTGFILIPVFWLVWSLSAKAQGTGSVGWGTIVIVKDQETADIMGFKKPDTYLGTRDGKNFTAVRGGLKLIFTFSDIGFGFKALKSGIFSFPDGYIFVGTFFLWLLTIILLIFRRKRKTQEA